MAYLIDSNIFIRSKNEMPMNLWPTFWQRMTDMVNSGELFISTKVKEEIERGNDELTEWLKHSAPKEGTEKLKPTIKLKVDDGETAVLPFIICLF